MKTETIIAELKQAREDVAFVHSELDKEDEFYNSFDKSLRSAISRIRFCVATLRSSEADTVRLGKEES